MTHQGSNIKFIRADLNKVFDGLISADKELETHFTMYLKNEYKEHLNERHPFIDIGEIARLIVLKLKIGKTDFFQTFFDLTEDVLLSCDKYVEDLMVVGLFESIQNICGSDINYHSIFNKWLKPTSQKLWDNLIDSWEGQD